MFCNTPLIFVAVILILIILIATLVLSYTDYCINTNMHARIRYCTSRLRLIPAKFREEGKATRKVEKLEVELSDGREDS